MIELAPYQLKAMLEDANKLGAMTTLRELGLLKPYMSLNEAYKKYGRGVVDRWIKEELIVPVMDGVKTKMRLDRIELETLSMTSNRHSWFNSNRK